MIESLADLPPFWPRVSHFAQAAPFALAFYALGIVADVITTNKLLDRGGRELNPVPRFFQEKLGTSWWLAKAVLNVIAALIALYTGFPVLLWIGGALSLLVAWSNHNWGR